MDSPDDVAITLLSDRKKGRDSEASDDGEEMPPLEDVLGEFKSAMSGGNMGAAARAFKAAIAICQDDPEESDEPNF